MSDLYNILTALLFKPFYERNKLNTPKSENYRIHFRPHTKYFLTSNSKWMDIFRTSYCFSFLLFLLLCVLYWIFYSIITFIIISLLLLLKRWGKPSWGNRHILEYKLWRHVICTKPQWARVIDCSSLPRHLRQQWEQ